MIDFNALAAPFPPDAISWRVGATTQAKDKALALAYIDARDVMERLDAVCGPDGWQNRYTHAQGTVVCEIGIKINAEWVWKADGAGATDVEAEKGSLSDAFKRAAVRWGIGRYLYDLDSPWVAVESAGRSVRIKKEEYARLRQVAARAGGRPPAQKKEDKPDPNEPANQKAIDWCENMRKAADGMPKTNIEAMIEREKPKLDALAERHPLLHTRLMADLNAFIKKAA